MKKNTKKNWFAKRTEQPEKEVDMVSVFTRPRSVTEDLPTDTSKVSSVTLGADVEFNGSLNFKEKLSINGKFEGDLNSEGGVLIVGRDAEVKADVRVGNLIAEGRIYGNITANDKVELRAPAQIFGNIEASRLSMEEGVVFVGNSNVNPSEVEPEVSQENNKAKKSYTEEEDSLENQITF